MKLDATKYHDKYMKTIIDIPKDIQKLAKKQFSTIDITIRNIYPPHTDNMQGYHKIIGPYGWEESKFPQEYISWFNTDLTMLFATSNYVKDVFIKNGVKIPVVVTAEVVEDILHIDSIPLSYDLPQGFKLLHISSAFPRKGIDKLLEAFDILNIPDISLVLKTFPNQHNKTIKQLESLNYKVDKIYEEDVSLYTKNDKEILFINKDISQKQIKYLYENSNILVAPSFGEGFGLPMAEAMLLDTPVITTGYGGQTDFCTTQTSWLIDYDLVEAKTHLNLKNSIWAKPQVNSLVKQIKTIYNTQKDKIAIKTTKAKQYILDNYSSKQIAQNIQDAIINNI